MNPAVYGVVAVIAILFVLACRHIYRTTIGGGGCCGGGGDCPACRERKMKLHSFFFYWGGGKGVRCIHGALQGAYTE